MDEYVRDGRDSAELSPTDRRGMYRAIFSRRDVRGQFRPDPVPAEVLSRILTAAHFAPSVGFMQPWNFVVVTSTEVRRRVHDAFAAANAEAVAMFEGAKRETYASLKLEGILEAPVNICVTCDESRAGPVVIGRTHNPIMDQYSTVRAVQNLWLAARAEGLGVGWVSIFHHEALRDALAIPPHIVPVAYLCLGYVTHFPGAPELEAIGWRKRLKLAELTYFDQWGHPEPGTGELTRRIATDSDPAQGNSFISETLAGKPKRERPAG